MAQNWKGPSQVRYPDIFPTIDVLRDLVGFETQVLFTTKDIFLIGVTVPLMVALHLFIRHSTLGKAMRATAQDREAAAMMGINVERIIMLTFFIGGRWLALPAWCSASISIPDAISWGLRPASKPLQPPYWGASATFPVPYWGVSDRTALGLQRSIPVIGVDTSIGVFDPGVSAGVQADGNLGGTHT